MNYTKKSGFTLVELSIVIVILGIIIAGVSAGRSLVNSFKIRSQASDLQMYSSAFNAFVAQYNAIPGDMKNASSYWSGANDGNGDGSLSCNEDNGFSAIECRSLFEHLSRANLISGFYDSSWAIGVGFPRLKLNSKFGMFAGSYFSYSGSIYQLTGLPEDVMHRKATLYMNIVNPTAIDSTFNDGAAVMTPAQAFAIDTKIDDGVARKGKFKAYRPQGVASSCLTSNGGDYIKGSGSEVATCDAEYILK